MILLIIFTALLVYGVYLSRKWSTEATGIVVSFIFGFLLIIHTFAYFTSGYTYNTFKVERDAFVSSLNDSRDNGSYESAAALKDIARWNQQLKIYQYQNSHLFLDQYVDDRFNDLKPIK